MDEPRLQHRVDDATQNEMLAYVLEHALDAGQASVKRGPELLPILRDAGVVDAGGYGLTIIFAGVIAALRGAEPPPLEHHAPARITQPAARTPRPIATARTSRSPARALEPAPWIAAAGARSATRVLVVGDAHTLKVHVHTDEPERATRPVRRRRRRSRASTSPTCTSRSSSARRASARRSTPAASLAVVNGDGMRALFEGMGAHVLDGGATLNPSTYELLAGIHEVPAEEVVVLPELAERPHGRRARRRALREARPRRADALDGRRAWPPRSRWTRRRRRAPTPPRWTRRCSASAPAASPRPPATTPRAASAAATPSASSTRSSSPGASRGRRSRSCSASSAARPSC